MFREAIRLPKRLLFLLTGDVLALIGSPFIAGWIYFSVLRLSEAEAQPDPILLAAVPVYLLSLALFDCYNYQRGFRSLGSVLKIAAAVALAGLVIILAGFFLGRFLHQGRIIFMTSNALVVAGVALVRALHNLPSLFGFYSKTAVIVGCGDSGKAIAAALAAGRMPEIRPLAFLDVNPEKAGQVHSGVPVVHQKGSLREAAQELNPGVLILAMRRKNYMRSSKDVIWLAQRGVDVWDAPTAFELVCSRVPLAFVDEQWLLSVAVRRPRLNYRRVKRLMDVCLSAVGLLAALPVMLLTAVAIRLDSPGPVLIRQVRIGMYGKPFKLLKFRSMVENAAGLPAPNPNGSGPGDPRITRVGRVIRRLHLDELPQLVNVLIGDLSLIGPRAELLDFVRGYFGGDTVHYCTELAPESLASGKRSPDAAACPPGEDIIPYFEQRFTVQQGVTGWAQVQDPFATSSLEDMLRKLEYDLYYIKNICFALDALIIIKTIKVMALGKGK